MARVIGIHHLELKPGVTAQAFEEFFWKEYLPNAPKFSDTRVSLLKGDKGDQMGKYMIMIEFDSDLPRSNGHPVRTN